MKIAKAQLAAFLAGVALAASPARAQQAAAPLPTEKTYHYVIPYVTGGVPEAQVPVFKAARNDYPLAAEVYEKIGSKYGYTALVDLTVTDETGRTVLQARTDGPFLYARVPPGTYRLKAELNGKTVQSKPVTVREKGTARAMLVFPEGTSD